MQFHIPKEGGVGFQAQQRVVGAFATVAGIVAHLGAVLPPEYSHDGAVQIEDQTRTMGRPMDEGLQQSIIDAMQLLPEPLGRMQQETAQSLRIGKAGQAGKVLKGAVGTKE